MMLLRSLQKFCSSRLAWTIQQQLPDKNLRGARTATMLKSQKCGASGCHQLILLDLMP